MTLQIASSLDQAHDLIAERPVAATFGVFDGLHLGHRDLITRTVDKAKQIGGISVVLTFHQHPLHLLAPVYAPPTITAWQLRREIFESLGVDLLVIVDFNRAFANQSPQEFAKRVLLDRLAVKSLCMGFNNRFGKGGKGDTAQILELGKTLGFEVDIVPPTVWKESVVSSTRVRQLLIDGRIRKANELLGRTHAIIGEVIHGESRGHTLGFPTANISIGDDMLIPCGGVYAVRGRVGDGRLGGVMNIGSRPTFGEGEISIEVHLFEFDLDLYGERLRVELVERIRPEQKFSSADDLVAQITRDLEAARTALARAG